MKKALALSTLIALMGCVHSAPPADVRGETEFQAAAALSKGNKYAEAVVLYRKIAFMEPPAPESPDALFEIARLEAFYDNPQKDYAMALSLFEEFLKRYPGHAKVQDAENWRAVLKTLLELKKENERLNRSIEQLKRLDIRHEERRGK